MNLKNDYVECPVNPKRYHSQAMRTLFSVMNSEDIKENDGKYIFDLDFVRKIYKLEPATYKKLIKEFGLRGIKVHTQKNNKIFIRVSEPPYHIISANEKSKKFEDIIFPNSIQMTLNGLDVQDDTFFDGIIIEQFSELFPFDYNFDDLKRSFTSHGFKIVEVTTTAKRKTIKHDVRLSMVISDETIINLLKKNGVFFLSQLNVSNLNRIFKHGLNTPAREKFIKQVVCDYYTQGYEVVPKDAYDFCKADIQENVIETKKTETEKVSSSDDKKDGYISVLFKNEASFPLLKKAKIDLLSELNNFKIHQFFDELSFHGKARISFDTQVNFLYVTGYDVITAEFNQKCLNDKTIELKKMKQISLESTNEDKRTVDQKVSSEVAELKHQSEDVYLPGLISESGLVTLLKQNDFLYLSQVNPHSLDDLFQKPGFILMRQENVKKIICECFEKGNSLVTQETYDYCRNVQDQLNVNEEKPQEIAESEVQEHHNDITATTDFISDKDDTEKNLSRENMLKIKIKKTILESGLGTREDIKLTKLISDARTTTLLRFYRITKLSQVSISNLNKLFSNSLCGYDNEQLIKQTVRACYEAGSKLISRATYEFCGGTSQATIKVDNGPKEPIDNSEREATQVTDKTIVKTQMSKDILLAHIGGIPPNICEFLKQNRIIYLSELTRKNLVKVFGLPECDAYRQEIIKKIVCDYYAKGSTMIDQDAYEFCRKYTSEISSVHKAKEQLAKMEKEQAKGIQITQNSERKGNSDQQDISSDQQVIEQKNTELDLISNRETTGKSQVIVPSSIKNHSNEDIRLSKVLHLFPSTVSLLSNNGIDYLSQLTKLNLERLFKLPECHLYQINMCKQIVRDYYEKGFNVISRETYEFCDGKNIESDLIKNRKITGKSQERVPGSIKNHNDEDIRLSKELHSFPSTVSLLSNNGIDYLSQLTKTNLERLSKIPESHLYQVNMCKQVVRDYYEKGYAVVSREDYEFCGGTTLTDVNVNKNEHLMAEKNEITEIGNSSLEDNSSEEISGLIFDQKRLAKDVSLAKIMLTSQSTRSMLKRNGIEYVSQLTKPNLSKVFDLPECYPAREEIIKKVVCDYYEKGLDLITEEAYKLCGGFTSETNNTDQNDEEEAIVKDQDKNKSIIDNSSVKDNISSKNNDKMEMFKVDKNKIQRIVREEYKLTKPILMTDLITDRTTLELLKLKGIEDLTKVTKERLGYVFNDPFCSSDVERQIKETIRACYEAGSAWISMQTYEFCGGKSDTEQKVVKEQESHKDVANVDIKIEPIVNDKNVTDQDESQNQQKPVEERKNNSESIDFVNVVQNEVKTQVSEKKAEKKTPEDVSLAKLMSKSPSTNAVLRRNGIKYLSQLTQKKLIKLFELPEFYPYRQRAIKEIVIEYYQKGSSFVSEEAYEFCKYGNVTTHKNNAKMNEVKAKMEEVDKGPRISEIIQKSPTTVELLGQNGIVYLSQLATGKLARIFNMPECHLYQRQLIEKAVCSCYEKNSKWISREVYEFCGGTRTEQKDIRIVGMVDNSLSEKDKVAEIKQHHQEAKKVDEETEQKNIFIHRELKDDDPTILKVLGAKIDDVFAEANAIWISEIDQEALYHVLSSPGLGDKDKNRVQNKLIELYEDGYENISQEVYEACKRVSKGSLVDSNSNEPAKVTTKVEQNSDDPEIFKVFSDQEIINAFARVNVVWLSDISGFNLNRLLTDPSLSPEKKQLIQKTISDLYDQGYRKVNWKVYQICQADLGFGKNAAVEPVRTLTIKDSISKPEPQQIRRRSNLAPELVEFLNEQTEEQNKLHAGYFFVEPIYRKIMTRADLFDKLPSTTYLQKRDLFTSLLKDGADQYYLRGDYPILYVDQNPSLETIISDHFEDKKITNKNLTEFAKDIGFDDGKKLIKKLANNAAFFEFRPGEFVSTHSLQLSMSELEQVKDYLASFVNQDGYAVMGQIIINPNKLPELKNRMDWSPKLLAFYVDQIPEYKNLNWEYIYATSKAVTQNNYIMCLINKPWRNLLDLVQYEVKTNYHDSLSRDKVGRFLDRKHIYTDNNNKLPDYIVKNVFDVDRDHVLHLKDVI